MERELAEARGESKLALEALGELRVRHDALSKTLRHLQAEHRLVSEDRNRLALMLSSQAVANAEEEAKAEADMRAQLERALRLSSSKGPTPGSATARLREEIMLAAQEMELHEEKPARGSASSSDLVLERRRNIRPPAHASGEAARLAAPPPRAQAPVPPSVPKPPARGATDLAERLRALEGAANPAEVDRLREEAAGLRRELEKQAQESAQREEDAAKAIAQLRGSLSASEVRRQAADAEAQKQLQAVRVQVTALRNQIAADRRDLRENRQPYPPDLAAAANRQHPSATADSMALSIAAGGRKAVPRSRASSVPGGEAGTELAHLITHISEQMQKRGIAPIERSDEDDDEDRLGDELAAEALSLAGPGAKHGRRVSAGGITARPLGPHAPSGRELHARLTSLEPTHSSLVQLKHSVRANANRARRPTNDIAVASTADPAAGNRRKTIAVLRTRLDRAKSSATAAEGT